MTLRRGVFGGAGGASATGTGSLNPGKSGACGESSGLWCFAALEFTVDYCSHVVRKDQETHVVSNEKTAHQGGLRTCQYRPSHRRI
jgi:hypothetical protein